MVATASAGSLDLCQVTEWLRVVTGRAQGWGGTTFWGHTDLGLNSSSTTYQLGDLQKVLFISRSLSSARKQEPRRCCEFTTVESGGCDCCCHRHPGGSLPPKPDSKLQPKSQQQTRLSLLPPALLSRARLTR